MGVLTIEIVVNGAHVSRSAMYQAKESFKYSLCRSGYAFVENKKGDVMVFEG